MSLHATWAACAIGIARCLSATTPELAEFMFGAAREAGAFDRGWVRLPPSLAAGYVQLGPLASDHRYAATPPRGITPDAPAMPSGRLRVEAALALSDPGATAGLLREVALGFLRDLARDGPAAFDAFSAAAVARRVGCAAGGKLWALSLLRAAAAPLAKREPPPPVLFRLFDPFGAGAQPDTALAKAVADLREAGELEPVMDLPRALLARAEAARDRALESRGVVAHGAALHAAAGDAWAAARLAGLLHPGDDATRIAAVDIALRATHALVIDALNLGSGSVLLAHRAQIEAEGTGRADELIEHAWFYPRALRDTLLA